MKDNILKKDPKIVFSKLKFREFYDSSRNIIIFNFLIFLILRAVSIFNISTLVSKITAFIIFPVAANILGETLSIKLFSYYPFAPIRDQNAIDELVKSIKIDKTFNLDLCYVKEALWQLKSRIYSNDLTNYKIVNAAIENEHPDLLIFISKSFLPIRKNLYRIHDLTNLFAKMLSLSKDNKVVRDYLEVTIPVLIINYYKNKDKNFSFLGKILFYLGYNSSNKRDEFQIFLFNIMFCDLIYDIPTCHPDLIYKSIHTFLDLKDDASLSEETHKEINFFLMKINEFISEKDSIQIQKDNIPTFAQSKSRISKAIEF